jgi:urea transport system permease protein
MLFDRLYCPRHDDFGNESTAGAQPADRHGRLRAQLMTVVLDSLTASATLLIVIVGLTLVLGVLEVINLAHAGFMAVGVYLTYALLGHGVEFFLACVLAAAGTAVLGLVVELLVVRRLYRRPIDTILATWGIALVIVQVITLIAGSQDKSLSVPVNHTLDVFGTPYASYQLLLVAIAVVQVGAMGLLVRFTEVGRTVRLVMSNEAMARGIGIDTTRVRQVTFVLGAALAGLSGGLIGPLEEVSPQYATALLIPAFLTVLVAGPSVSGMIIASVVLATIQTVFATYADSAYSTVVLVLSAVVILRFAPHGLGLRGMRLRVPGLPR